eukprot:4497394-Pyramimonas_sp.AAC.1
MISTMAIPARPAAALATRRRHGERDTDLVAIASGLAVSLGRRDLKHHETVQRQAQKNLSPNCLSHKLRTPKSLENDSRES